MVLEEKINWWRTRMEEWYNQPSLPDFDDTDGEKWWQPTQSARLCWHCQWKIDISSIFSPEFILTIFKTETNKYAKSVIDKTGETKH